MYTILLVIHTIVVIFMIMLILIQRTDSDGLGGLSGGGGNQFLTGRGAANLMTRTTAVLATVFFLTSLTLAIMASRMTERSIVDSVPVPATTQAPATPTAIPGKEEKIQNDSTEASKMKSAAPVKPAAPSVPKPE